MSDWLNRNPVVVSLLGKYPELESCIADVAAAFNILKTCFEQGGKLLVCGNGGSASDSEHIVGELMKGFMLKRPIPESFRFRLTSDHPDDGEYMSDHLQGALPAISLVSHIALISAFSNDVAADMVFAQQVYGYGVKGDVVLGLSTSGNSANVVYAMKIARSMGLRTIAMTGSSGGKLFNLCDTTIRVPFQHTPDIQERHLPLYHALCILLEEALFAQ
jgi:phosphoheptose isomerase